MTSPSASAPLLSLTEITQYFGPVTALDRAHLTVRPGTVHALLGENGAGKTTLMRVAFGLLQPSAGTIQIRGHTTTVPSPAAAITLGIGMVHQHFSLVPAMTVAENVALGGHGRFNPHEAAQRVTDVGARAGLTLDPHARISDLPVAAQQRCEIVKALAREAALLILDEPTAVLAPQEAADLLQWMRRFADQGHAVVLITHKLRDALAIADDITVLRHGRVAFTGPAANTTQDQLRTAMVGPGTTTATETGASTAARTSPSPTRTTAPVLSLTHVSVQDARGTMRLRDVSLAVHPGEILGIAAVEGAGHHELLRVLAGRLEPTHGTVQRPATVGFVPEDRHRDALMLDAPLYENLALRGAGARTGRMPWDTLVASTAQVMQARDVRASGPHARARTLSGGNQQKFVLGRELREQPEAVIVENPSRGLDFHATAAVQAALRDARDQGAAVVLYSSDLDEVLMLADRVVAMFDGQVTEVAPDRDAVGRAMLGAS